MIERHKKPMVAEKVYWLIRKHPYLFSRQEIAKKSGLKRTTTWDYLQRLLKANLIKDYNDKYYNKVGRPRIVFKGFKLPEDFDFKSLFKHNCEKVDE